MVSSYVYINYSIRVLCSVIVLLLNPITLRRGIQANAKNAEISMLLFHLCVKTALALLTLVYSICSVVEFEQSGEHALLVFWTTLLHQALLPAVTFSDLFVTLDRTIAISFPLPYAGVKKKLVICAAFTCLAIFGIIVIIYLAFRIDNLGGSLSWKDSVDPVVAAIVLNFTFGIMIPLIFISVVFLAKYRRYRKRLAFQTTSGKSLKLINNVVFQQVIISIVVWICPTLVKLFFEYGLHLSINGYIRAEPTVTLILIYIALCSIMYWKKLVRGQNIVVSNPQNVPS
ncbi:hypothetical protein QR680_013936 [Steinernema hermaphroditum]|uniref:Uncharacterized protein n=1 Tax=Steinernema hermaphroditum TaxID=289476 RepID=A0AA39I990_9BILA|nr:hypothetical protein QR680_013936 [Steinernema hermaphroditum]